MNRSTSEAQQYKRWCLAIHVNIRPPPHVLHVMSFALTGRRQTKSDVMLPQLLWGLDTGTGAGRPIGSIHSRIHAVLVCQVGVPQLLMPMTLKCICAWLDIQLLARMHDACTAYNNTDNISLASLIKSGWAYEAVCLDMHAGPWGQLCCWQRWISRGRSCTSLSPPAQAWCARACAAS